MPNEQIQQALQRLNYNCQPPEARRSLSMADYAEAHAALHVIQQAASRLDDLEVKVAELEAQLAAAKHQPGTPPATPVQP